MKASIITLHTSVNYGSVLQTYATQKIFEKLGYEVEFIDYCRPNNNENIRIEKTFNSKKIRFINKCSFGLFRPYLKKIVKNRVRQRSKPMNDFIKKYIHLSSRRYLSVEDICTNPPIADLYVTGSDQVWNSDWNEGIDLAYYLSFAPKCSKKIAFSASIGKTDIDDDEREKIIPYLKEYNSISVREKSAVDLLQSMDIESSLVLDPTLMLDKNEWSKISKTRNCTKKYLLIYQLNQNNKMDKYAIEYAKRNNLCVKKICKNPAPLLSDKKIEYISLPSVEELVGLFEMADCVLTDSFHGTAFSLNLGKNFACVLPPRFGTRIQSILELTGTKHRLMTDYSDENIFEVPIEWDKVNAILNIKRTESLEFLYKAIHS